MNTPFVLIYLPGAEGDYGELDGSQKDLIDKGLKKLECRAKEIGKPLHGDLAGCRALKWRKVGLRLVYRIGPGGHVEIVEIVAIGKRSESEVYSVAASRLRLENSWLFNYVRAQRAAQKEEEDPRVIDEAQ